MEASSDSNLKCPLHFSRNSFCFVSHAGPAYSFAALSSGFTCTTIFVGTCVFGIAFVGMNLLKGALPG